MMEETEEKKDAGIRYNGCLFLNYIKDCRYAVAAITGSIFLVHGARLFSINVGIDTESIIYDRQALYESWLCTGRHGLVLLKALTGTLKFNPFWDGALTLLLLSAACLCFGFVFHAAGQEWSRERRGAWGRLAGFGILLALHPVLTEQMYFALQSKEIAGGFVLLAFAALGAHYWAAKGKLRHLALPVLLMLLVFSIYQALVPMYLFTMVSCGVLYFNSKEGAQDVKKNVIYLLRHGIAFLIGFGINQMLTERIAGACAYLTDQIRWDRGDVMSGVWGSVDHMASVLTGKGEFYTPVYSLLCLLVFALLMLRIRQIGRRSAGLWYLLLYAGIAAGPFYMTLVLGGSPVIRAQLTLPLATGFLLYYAGVLAGDLDTAVKRVVSVKLLRVLRISILLLAVAAVWQEGERSSRMYYTEEVRFSQDKALGEHLMQRIGEVSGEREYSGKVVFVGAREEQLNHSCEQGDVMGQSIFAWDQSVEPVNYYSSRRMTGFMHTLGAGYLLPDREEVSYAVSYAEGMPAFPTEGSITRENGMIIVNLGN